MVSDKICQYNIVWRLSGGKYARTNLPADSYWANLFGDKNPFVGAEGSEPTSIFAVYDICNTSPNAYILPRID